MYGHNMAVDEVNAAGGIMGQKVVTFARDTKLKPAAAAAAAKELITKEDVDVLVGGLSSAVGLAISEVARQEGVVYIATIPKTIQMTTNKLHKYVFRTSSHTDFEGDAIAQIVKKLGKKSICDIQLDYAYGHDLAAGIEKGLARHAPNVKKLIDVDTVTYGGVNNQSATITCTNPHGLLVGDQVTIYGANPIIYNGTFLVTSRDSDLIFQYNLPQPATVIPQGNILAVSYTHLTLPTKA